MAVYIIVSVIAYLLGSISFSIIISKKMAGFDVRDKGSKNAGSTNVLRTVGKKAAIITLICDCLKGVIAILIAYIAGKIWTDLDSALLVQLAGIFVVFVNDKKLFHLSYERYLVNQLRKEFGLVGTPIRIISREKIG